MQALAEHLNAGKGVEANPAAATKLLQEVHNIRPDIPAPIVVQGEVPTGAVIAGAVVGVLLLGIGLFSWRKKSSSEGSKR
jgi:hypothetical protein